MAKNAQGLTATLTGDWGDYDLTEVVAISIDGVQSDTIEITPRTVTARDKLFRPADRDNGTVSLTTRRIDVLTSTHVGSTCSLSIVQGGLTYWDGPATVQSLAWQASVGELQEWRLVLKLGVA